VTTFLETIAVGPVPIFFCNTNTTMRLKGHCHHAFLTVTYRTTGGSDHGYPSFETTNNALRARIRDLTGTDHPFRDATNETVLRRLWEDLDGWTAVEWLEWGGEYQLHALDLDVLSAHDRIGHDAGATRYHIERLRGAADERGTP